MTNKPKNGCNMKILCVNIPQFIVDRFDELVSGGMYPSRSEAMRDACRHFIIDQVAKMKLLKEPLDEDKFEFKVIGIA